MTRPLRIGVDTLFEDPFQPSGATGYLKTLLTYLPLVGPQHEFVAYVSAANRDQWHEARDVRLVEAGASNERRTARILSQQLLLPWRIRRDRLDVFNAPGNVGPQLSSVPLVLTIKTLHHYHTPHLIGRWRTAYRRLMVSASAARARLIIANCNATKDDIVRYVGVPEERVRVVYEAIHASFSPVDDRAAASRQMCGELNLAGPYALFVSSLWPYKNVDGLLRAFAALPADLAHHSLVIVGGNDGGYRTDLERLADDLGIRMRTRFLGAVENTRLPALYRGAQLLVYPSHQETFGMPLVEAMRSGTPIVCSDLPPLREVGGDVPLFVRSTDVAQLTEAMAAVLGSAERRAAMGARGLERGTRFTGERMAADTLAVYEEAVEMCAHVA